MLRLGLVVAAMLSSGAALPLVRGGEGSVEEGGALPGNGAMLATAEHADQWEVGAEAWMHAKALHRAEELRSGGAPQDLVVSSP